MYCCFYSLLRDGVIGASRFLTANISRYELECWSVFGPVQSYGQLQNRLSTELPLKLAIFYCILPYT